MNENRHYLANTDLVRWEADKKQTFHDRGKSDHVRYLGEDLRYNGTMP